MHFRLTILSALLTSMLYGQVKDYTGVANLQEITITGYTQKNSKLSPLNIGNIKLDSANKYGSYTLTEILSQKPGVSSLSTGIGIAKPVIRGLYGNRILILLNGLKFDNQQWQEEHGLGLTATGISKIELIKGPLGILYGSEALGGVINIIEETIPMDTLSHLDAGVTINSNTLGGTIQVGYAQMKNNKWSRFRIGVDNNSDYSDGKNKRVLNSRFDGYSLKYNFGLIHKKWKTSNTFSSSFNRFGFIFNDVYTFITPDKRWSRSLNTNPGHYVVLNMFSSENTLKINKKSTLQINGGIQSNWRMENEGSGAISLNMHLITAQYLLKYEYDIDSKNKLIISSLNSVEDNTNYGARKIVPDANMQEANVSAYLQHSINDKLIWDNGIGIGEKFIHTFFTATVNGQGKEVQPFKKISPYYNLLSGISYLPNSHVNIKANVATGIRIANLAELSSNGLHEGVFTYEIGNPNLKNEQLIAGNLIGSYSSSKFEISVSPFFNYFNNYIYLTPVNEQWYGFPVYRYKQQNAKQYGGEFSGAFKPNNKTTFQLDYSGMISKTADGYFTPFTPSQKLVPTARYSFKLEEITPIELFANMEYNWAQNNTAPFEIKTPSYSLFNAGISTSLFKKNTSYKLSLSVNNIFNKAYYDNLSRFKNYGLLNIGRNIIVNFKIKI